jgi:iron complex outermembrane recepter protein
MASGRNLTTALLASCAICSLSIGVAHAQTTDAKAPDAKAPEAGGAATLEEVVVTAQHRTENLQNTPVAVTAISGRELSEQGIQTSEALNGIIPNFRVGEGSREIEITIRGITASNVGPNQDAPVAVYLNGVYLTRPSFIGSAFFDMERVEVLRGPQGTLFGRNATGGAVDYISAKPVDTYEGAMAIRDQHCGRGIFSENFRDILDNVLHRTTSSSEVFLLT